MKRITFSKHLARAAMTLLVMLLCSVTGAWADDVEIGDGGTTNNSYLPGYNYYNYSLTQQIYTADEIGMAGTINSIAFKNTGAEKTRTYKVYMALTDKETFSGGSDWVAMSETDLVFSGELTFPVDEWTTISLDTPFAYDGTSNLIVTVSDVTGSYSSSPHMACLVFDATSQAIRAYRDASAYDVTNPGTAGSVLNMKNQIILGITPSGGVTVPAPTSLVVSNITSNEAFLTWAGGTGRYNVECKKTTETEWGRVLTGTTQTSTGLANLEPQTTYQVRVQSVSGNDVSSWKSASFMTAFSFPYSQDFSASGIPTGWALYTGLLDDVMNGTALSSTSYGWSNGTSNGVLDGNNIYANIYGTSSQKWIVTPAILLGSNARLSFDVAYTAYSGTAADPATDGDDDKFVVLISTDNMATWTILRQWDNAGSEFVLNNLTPSGLNVAIDLSAYNGQSAIVAFYAESTVKNADNNIHVDNVVLEVTPSCEKPQNVVINYTGGTTATVSWESNETSFDIEVNGVVTENVTSPYTLQNLELATTYNVRVRAKNSNGEVSDWTNAVSFTTDQCMPEDQCVLTFTLTDAWGDGWNGNAINVVDVETGTVIASMANENLNGTSGSGENEVNVKTLAVCNGREIQFQWVSGNYADECSYVVTDVNDEEIFSGSGAMSEAVTYTVNCAYNPYKKPTDLNYSDVTSTTAKLSWTENGTATKWVVAYRAEGENNFTEVAAESNPFTLTGLTEGTLYEVKVLAKYDENESNWSNSVTFRTDFCTTEDKCFITYELKCASGYEGYGWYGSYLLVVDDETQELIDYWTVSGDGTGVATGSLALCPGRTITFQWYSGSDYDAQLIDAIIVRDVNGDDIMNCTGALSEDVSYVVDCTEIDVRKPTDFAASEIGPHSVKLSWTENCLTPATEWVVAYKTEEEEFTEVSADSNPFILTGLDTETAYTVKVRSVNSENIIKWSDEITFTTNIPAPAPTDLSVTPYPTKADVSWNGFAESYDIQWAEAPAELLESSIPSNSSLWLQYDNGTYATSIGSSSSSEQTWGVMYPAAMLEGNNTLTKVAVYENSNYLTSEYTVNIYTGGDTAPETLVCTETVTPTGESEIHEVTLSTPVTIDPTQNLWITLTATGTYVKAACAGNTYSNNQWVLNNGAWAIVSSLNSALKDYGWMIRGFVDGYNPDVWTWLSENDVTSSAFTIESLQPETTYFVKVKGHFGEDGDSEWTWSTFTTPSQCDMPIDLVATDVKASSATLKWMGYQDSFEVQYRKSAVLFKDGFENGLDNWTTIDADGDGRTWVLGSECGGVYLVAGGSLAGGGHNGSGDLVVSGSFSNVEGVGALNPDNYLVSPLVPLGGTAQFYVCAQDASYPEEVFSILVSTAGNTDTSDFTTIESWKLGAAEISPWSSESKNQGNWIKVIVDLSDYAGQSGYVAIRHHDCSDQFMINIDDFAIFPTTTNPWTTVTTTDQSVSIANLDADSDYEWQVRGINESCDGGYTDWSEVVTFTTASVMNGDANGDGEVNIADVTAIINYINNNPPAGFNFDAANANGDEAIDIADVTAVINIINQPQGGNDLK